MGRLLAERLGATFVDLDTRIERLFGTSIAELFEQGEARFRRCERDALRSLLAEPGVGDRAIVVATGGGTVVDPRNMADMRAHGRTVHLEVPVATLAARLGRGHDTTRPLLGAADPAIFAIGRAAGGQQDIRPVAAHVDVGRDLAGAGRDFDAGR